MTVRTEKRLSLATDVLTYVVSALIIVGVIINAVAFLNAFPVF